MGAGYTAGDQVRPLLTRPCGSASGPRALTADAPRIRRTGASPPSPARAVHACYALALGGRLHQAISFDDGDITAIA